MRTRLLPQLAVCLLVFVPALAQANNTSSGGAYSLMPGATPSETLVNDTTPDRWYKFGAVSGRSYCVETQGGVFFETGTAAFDIDSLINVYRQDGATVVVGNDDASTEPKAERLSRACWISSFTEPTYIKVSRLFAGDAFNVRVRVVETTLFSPWYFVGSDYSAYTVLRNTTNTAVTFRINWRNAAGAVVGTTSTSLAANAGTFYDARAIAGVLPSNNNGTVEIVFDGSPGAIVANTTVLSATTGLSFDAPFTARPTW